jgi:hypothetical protein
MSVTHATNQENNLLTTNHYISANKSVFICEICVQIIRLWY